MNVGVGRLRRSAGDRICQAPGMIAGSESVTVTQALVGRKPGFARPTSRLTTMLDPPQERAAPKRSGGGSLSPRILLRTIVQSRGLSQACGRLGPLCTR